MSKKPNVLFIAVDDLNDWIGPMGGHPQAKTPNIDAFCREGSMVFQNAVCPGPVCGPSRSALLSGFMPHKTGLYGNKNNMLDSSLVQNNPTLPEAFSKNGYFSLSSGKIFHKHVTKQGLDSGQWAFDLYHSARGKNPVIDSQMSSRIKGVIKGEKIKNPKHTRAQGTEFAWGPTKTSFEKTKDYATAKWTADQLQKKHDQPFFMAIGLSKPHLPWYVPQEFFDLYDLDTLEVPNVKEDDYQDILDENGKVTMRPHPDYLWVKEYQQMKQATQAYLANVSYADACLGVIFDALKKSPHYDNTIVVLWGDHGWHLGEKLRYRKASLWIESVRNPLIVRTPKMKTQQDCHKPVNLIDLYPTLLSLCDLNEQKLDGHDFTPLLDDPDIDWHKPALTVSSSSAFSVLDPPWHYIHRGKGVCELYNLEKDPMEWNNLYHDKEYENVLKDLERHIPSVNAKEQQRAVSLKVKTSKLAPKESFDSLRKWK